MEFKQHWYMWSYIGQSYVSHMGQEDRTDTWDSSNTGTHGFPLDSTVCPTWDSRIGWTRGIQATLVCMGQPHVSHMGQLDRTDTWDSSNTGTCGIPLDSPMCPTLGTGG